MYRCEGDECGSDSDHEGFRREIVIPSVFPDGVYVLGVVWYGGLHFSRDRGMFPDYFSCSFVRIQGGVRVGGSYQPFFQDGDTGRFRRGGLCQMASSDAGECPKLGCTGRSFWGVPRPFQNGKKPRVLVTATVEKAFNGGADAGSTGGAVAVNKERGNDSNVKKPENIDEKKEKEDGTKEGRENEEKERNIDNIKEEGICRGSVCCLATCGQCGGSGCQRRPGGGPGCCMGVIRESGRDCRFVSAPCVR